MISRVQKVIEKACVKAEVKPSKIICEAGTCRTLMEEVGISVVGMCSSDWNHYMWRGAVSEANGKYT